MSEIPFRQVVASAATLASAAEADAATARQRMAEIDRIIDSMEGDEVDASSVGEAMEARDQAAKAVAAEEAFAEGVSAFSQNLSGRHQQLAEAHEDAPVQAAQRGFYEGN